MLRGLCGHHHRVMCRGVGRGWGCSSSSFFPWDEKKKRLLQKIQQQRRWTHSSSSSKKSKTSAEELAEKNQRILLYMLSVAMGTMGVSYASVPLYKMFCQETGFGGTTRKIDAGEAERMLKPVENSRVLRVHFDGQVSSSLPWSFRPAQKDIRLVPGESALAFYTCRNDSDHAITGIATYNVQPPKAGAYFNKIQCFCFDEQRLEAHEEVDMPVLFVIDPKFLDDPHLKRVSNLTLSYNFFKTGDDYDDPDLDKLQQQQDDDDDDYPDYSSSSSEDDDDTTKK